MSQITIRSSTGGSPKEIMEKAREAYERVRELEAQQAGENSSDDNPEHKSNEAAEIGEDTEKEAS